ncbi:metallophosphoesterase family protein [Bradyrhizobium iriomotense]|uniref:Phosphoesterase n=1 Tax=Bradyrhizobium iriomotense TaxID=441950 RepID=A0ABQ6BFF7_9BRAD|nr:metallophosphoesterase [Bradyrhizobium iriomotense]GLR90902.1 phosphoesterase [Bradyrhizobium iriomotense]
MSESFKTFRDPLLSLYQSAVTEVAKKIDSTKTANPMSRAGLQRSMLSTLPDIAADIAQREYNRSIGAVEPRSQAAPAARELSKAGIAQVCAEWGWRYLKAQTSRDEQAIEQLKNEFKAGTCDPAWITTLEEYRGYFENGKRKAIPYMRAATVGPKTIEIKANARVALMGDWGTGAPPAIEILQCIADEKPDVVVHLGDIYYSGTPAECQTNFLDPVNAILRKDKQLPVYSLSGNHDMYCGGVGFYGLIGELNPAPMTQPASFFCLRSADEKWQFLAMDTGLHDDNPVTVAGAVTYLEDDELAWHCDRIREFDGRTILLSHHQLFSAFSPIGPANPEGTRSAVNPSLLKAFQKMTETKQVAAWFWGHEHTLSIYEPFTGLKRGRCVGHGAVPVSVIDEIYKPLSDLDNAPSLIDQSHLATRGGVYNHGYAVLSLQPELCQAEYYQATSKGRELIYRESIS